MKPIDLRSFADYSEKIPTSQLSPTKPEAVPLWKILGAHFVDFGMSFMASVFMSVMFNEFVKLMITTKGLKLLYSEAFTLGLAGPILPLVMFSYFFFSYLFNDGQTYGMNAFKVRMKVRSMSYRDSFTWSTYSTLLCFSCGLLYVVKPEIWKNVKGHDYLYHELFDERSVFHVDLVSHAQTEEEEEIYSRAA